MNHRTPARAVWDAGDRPVLATLLDISGTRRCSERGCSRRVGVRCEYLDRRNRACDTAWCPEHRVVLEGRVFCRRHAATVNALPAAATGDLAPTPDVDSRAASLAAWVGRDLDGAVRAAIAARLQVSTDHIDAADVALAVVGTERRWAWERTWRGQAGDRVLRVGVVVEEQDEEVVAAHVNGEECVRLTPPWIGSRDIGPDHPRRRAFNTALIDAIDERLREDGA
jgi:hypothetical protein